MIGTNKWNYNPYFKPTQLNRLKLPYICRIAPKASGFDFDWFDKGEELKNHKAVITKVGDTAACKTIELDEYKVSVSGLENYEEYEFYVANSKGEKSPARLVRTGDSPLDCVMVNCLNPKDDIYEYSGRCLSSPSVVRTDSGKLLVSCTVFGDRSQWPSEPCLSLIYQSTDNGNTWDYVCDIRPMLNGVLHVHKGKIYLLGISGDYGDLIVGCSEDDGNTWCSPVTIARGEGQRRWGWHASTTPFFYKNKRAYKAIEYGYVNEKPTQKQIEDNPDYLLKVRDGYYMLEHYQTVLSIGEDEDWLNPENWKLAELSRMDEIDSRQCIEGNIVALPDGTMANMLRTINWGESLLMKINEDDPEAKMTFIRRVDDFPFSRHTSFSIIYDDKTNLYIAIGNDASEGRTHLCMAVSKDFDKWDTVYSIADARGSNNAFSNPSWIFDGDDILVMSRTAWNGAVSGHDTNAITFHRITDYKNIIKFPKFSDKEIEK